MEKKNEIETEDLCTYGEGLRILERSEQKNLKKQINDGSDSGRRNQNKIKTWNAMISISLMIRREKDHMTIFCNREIENDTNWDKVNRTKSKERCSSIWSLVNTMWVKVQQRRENCRKMYIIQNINLLKKEIILQVQWNLYFQWGQLIFKLMSNIL